MIDLHKGAWGALALLILAGLGCGGGDHGYDGGRGRWVTRAVAVGDLNGDGLVDVAMLSAVDGNPDAKGMLTLRPQVHVFPETEPPFDPPLRFEVGPDPQGLVLADLDQDGRLDLVILDRDTDPAGNHGIKVWRRGATLAAGFTRSWVGTGGRTATKVAVGDLNGDGRPDLAIVAPGGKDLLVAFQNADGSFKAPLSVALDGEPLSVACGAFQPGGGLPGMAVGLDGGKLVVLLPDGSGGFRTATTVTLPSRPRDLVLADLNGDGYPDLLAACSEAGTGTGSLQVCLQNSALACASCVGFAAPVAYPTRDFETRALAVSPAGAPGPRVVACASYGPPGDPGSVAVFRPDPAAPGSFLAADLYQGYWGPRAIALGVHATFGAQFMVVADGDTLLRFQDSSDPRYFDPPFILLR